MTHERPDDRQTGNPRTADQDMSLGEYLLMLWQYRLGLVGFVLVVGLAALGLNFMRASVYEATARLLVSPSKIGNDPGQIVNMGTYRALVINQSVVHEAMTEMGLGAPPHSLALSDVIANRLTVEALRETNVIQVTARLGEAAAAADLANRVSRKAIELARRLNQEDTVSARDMIKGELDAVTARRAAAEQRLEAYRKQADVESLRTDVYALLNQRATLLDLTVIVAAEKARIARITAELTRHEPIRSIRRSVDLPASPGVATIRPELLDPYVNPVHELLEQQLAEARTKLSGLEQQQTEVQRAVAPGSSNARKLSALVEGEAEISRLQTEAELATEHYREISTRYEDARLQVAARSPQLQLIDAAVPPQQSVSPRVLRDTVMSVMLAMAVGAAAVLLYSVLIVHGRVRT